jgi:hypothetical protein
MQPLEYICLGFCICLALVFALYYGSVVFLDWYNRVHLPSRPSEFVRDGDDLIQTTWIYNPEKKIAEKVFIQRDQGISAPKPPPPPVFCGTAPPAETHIVGTRLPPQTYDDKGNVKP